VKSPQRENASALAPRTDRSTTVADLRAIMDAFVRARLWKKYHQPKNLAMSLAVEAAELMEHFQWLTPRQSRALVEKPASRKEIADEMSDVLAFLLSLANATGIDLSAAFVAKMAANERKYPAQLCRGDYRKPRPRRGRD
jgi:NTP pyrophosphatase (non-canonical NTP hydrolase)